MRFTRAADTGRGLVAAMFLAAAGMGIVRADVVATGDRPPAVGVTIIAFHKGRLHYRLRTGREVTRGIEEIRYLQITGWPLFNLAEKQHRDGHLRQAAISYEKVLTKLGEPPAGKGAAAGAGEPGAVAKDGSRGTGSNPVDRELLVQCRLLRTYDKLGRFDRAVELYLEVIGRIPEVVETVQPRRLPAAGSTFLRAAALQVDAAIKGHGQHPVATALAKWRHTWPGQQLGDEPDTDPRGTAATRPAESPESRRVKDALAEIQRLVEAERFDQALARIEPLHHPDAGGRRADLYYWQGRALLGRSAGEDSQDQLRDQRRAGLAFMRVVIHFPGHSYAPECLALAAEICQRSGQLDQAAGLWWELVHAYPAAAPWTDRARQELGRIHKQGGL